MICKRVHKRQQARQRMWVVDRSGGSCFERMARGLEEDPELEAKLLAWTQQAPRSSILLNPVVLWGLSSLFPLAALVIALFFNPIDLERLSWLGLINLGLLGLFLKAIRSDRFFRGASVEEPSRIQGDDRHGGRCIVRIRASYGTPGRASVWIGIEPAEHLVSWIASSTGSMHWTTSWRPFFLNATMLYHLHSLRQLYAWKKLYADDILPWLDTLGEMDRWVSLATYRFNHPDFAFPNVDDALDFEADDIGHPFLFKGQARG